MITLLSLVALVAGVQDTALSVIPRPVHVRWGTGSFVLTARTGIVADRATQDIGYQLADWLLPATGYRLSAGGAAGTATAVVSLPIDPTPSRLGGGGYRLVVDAARNRIPAFPP